MLMATTGEIAFKPSRDFLETTRPMVLHARVAAGTGGGPDKTILNSPRYLTDLGYSCVCLYLRPPNDAGFEALRRRAADRHAELAEVDDRGAFDWRVVRKVLDACRQHNVTIWHGHDYKTNLLGLLLRRWHPMRLVTTVHGWVHHTRRTPLYYALDRWALRRYERVICVSNDLADSCRVSGVPNERVLQIDNAIDADEYTRRMSREEAKKRLGWPPQRFLIGAVGRLSHEKGFDLLIHAVAKLVGQERDVGLAIAGDGAEQAALERLVSECGMSERVRLLGFQSELIPFYEAMDAYVLSSRREGLPNVLLEAMAIAVPVVATRTAGVPNLIDDEVNGLLIDVGDVDGMAAAVARLMDDPALRQRLADAGRATILSRYSFAVRMSKVAAVYDELLHERPAGSGPRR
jgi:glycosyltransferase involved in cell wall biosynthesis